MGKDNGNSHGGGWGRSDPGSGRTPPPKEGDDCLSWLFAMAFIAIWTADLLNWIGGKIFE